VFSFLKKKKEKEKEKKKSIVMSIIVFELQNIISLFLHLKYCKLTGLRLMVGGSLMVQILGSLPPNKSVEAEEGKQKGDLLLLRDKQNMQNGLSASPLVVTTRKDPFQ